MFAFALAASLATAGQLAIPHERYELDNGLDVLLIEDHSTPVVHVHVWYHVGSKDETEGLTGFAHLFEHLMFQGSVSQPGEYFDPLIAVGASINGTTNTDRTNYFETVPSEFLPMALFLESDRMGWLLPELTQEKLDNQREVVRNERRQRYEIPPFGTAYGTLMENVFPKGHPYHHLTIGSHEDLQNASLDDVKAFFTEWYAPNNAVLAISGDFDPSQVRTLVDEYFGGIARGVEHDAWTHQPATIPAPIEVRETEDVTEQRVWMAWTSPGIYEPGDAELDLLSFTLSSGKNSRLYKALVETGIAKNVSASQGSRLLASVYTISATAADGHTTDEVVAVIDEVIADLLNENPPSEEDIAAAGANYEASMYSRTATIQGKASTAQFYNLVTGDADFVQEDLERYQATPEEVVQTSRVILEQPRVVLHIGPEPEEQEEPQVAETEVQPRTFWQRLFSSPNKAPKVAEEAEQTEDNTSDESTEASNAGEAE